MEEKMTERHAERNQILRLVRTFCGVEVGTRLCPHCWQSSPEWEARV
ncbi:hypothetical protein CKAH01_05221 [Colletotrichum kahawae]|nr:hypothetical protein CKAH01_05221 [Colletotrichum kahawae]